MKGINFLRLQQEKIRQKTQRLFFIQLSALAILLVFVLILVGVFAYYFILARQTKVLEEKISFQKARIEEAVGVETKQFYLKKKASNLGEILKSVKNHHVIIEGVFSLLPEGVEIEDFAVSGEEEISFQGKALTFASLKNLFESVKKGQLGGPLPIYAALVDKVSLAEGGGFDFGLNLHLRPLPKEKKEEIKELVEE